MKNTETKRQRVLHLYWFSGSGNTLQVAELFAEKLRELGWSVELKPIETSAPSDIDPTATFGIAFPTHCFAIPELIVSFVGALPQVDGTEAVFLGTHGAFSGGVCGPLKRKLSAKGFRCVAGRIFTMPDSFWPITGKSFNHWLRNRMKTQVDRFAVAVNAGQGSWSRIPLLSDMHGMIFGGFFASRKFFKSCHTTVHVDLKRCTHCGLCVESCPVKALSLKTSASPPIPKMDCTNCLRCVAVCPTDAMRHLIGFSPYRNETTVESLRDM